MSVATNLCALAALSCLGGCSPSSSAPAPASAPVEQGFVAFAADFHAYRTWTRTTVVDDGGNGGAIHTDTVLAEYINDASAAGFAVFPVGTLIVKEGTTGDPATRQAFAMSKRGDAYNEAGVPGWEWLELQNLDDAGDVQIVWRGTAPPQSQVYAGNVNGDCNTCHAKAPHDGVFAE
jgi:hypothetical protein